MTEKAIDWTVKFPTLKVNQPKDDPAKKILNEIRNEFKVSVFCPILLAVKKGQQLNSLVSLNTKAL